MKKTYIVSGKKELISKLRRLLILAVCIFIGCCLIIYPQRAKDSIKAALNICGDTVIASLFPFLFLSAFITESGALLSSNTVFSKITQKLFKMPYEGLCVFISGAVGGFPVGASMASSLCESGAIGKESAKRLIFSCVCPAPAFAVTAVGVSLFSSSKTGLIIYFSVIISNFILFIVSRFFFGEDEVKTNLVVSKKKSFSSAFVSAGSKASQSMISICCYVLLFSCLCEMIRAFTDKEIIISSLCAFFEVTTGCRKLSFLSNIPLIAGVIGWGGLSVHFQIMEFAEKAGLSLKMLFVSRAACAFLSVLICDILLRIFPGVTDVISMRTDIILKSGEKSLPVSVMMLITCFVFLLGDCTIRFKNTAH